MENLELTEEERANVEKFRAQLADFIAEDEMAAELCSEDFTLWRFLTARQNDLKKAEEMLRGAVAWRQTCFGVGIDELWESRRVRKERTQGDSSFYGGLSGVSKAGGCVMVERMGKVDAKGLVKDNTVFQEVLQAYSVYLERCFRFVRATKNKTRAVVIVDLEGLSMSHIYNISVIKQIARYSSPQPSLARSLCFSPHSLYCTPAHTQNGYIPSLQHWSGKLPGDDLWCLHYSSAYGLHIGVEGSPTNAPSAHAVKGEYTRK
jgi:hypothetical protein